MRVRLRPAPATPPLVYLAIFPAFMVGKLSYIGAERLADHVLRQGDLPVSEVLLYRRDAVVVKGLPSGVRGGCGGKGTVRGDVKEFSMRSRLRLLHFVRNCNAEFQSMITLTYPASFPVNGDLCKKHLDRFTKDHLAKLCPGGWVWFFEFQQRGAPHFHILCARNLDNLTRKHYFNKKRGGYVPVFVDEELQAKIRKAWFRVVGSGDQRHLRAGATWEAIEHTDGALRYAACHASKGSQKSVPAGFERVGRFWGHSRNVTLSDFERVRLRVGDVFRVVGEDALSSNGRVRKFLFDAVEPILAAVNDS